MNHKDVKALLRDRGMCGHVYKSDSLITGMTEDVACVLAIGHDLGAHEIGVAELARELAQARDEVTELKRMIEALDQHAAHSAEVIKQLGVDKDGVYHERNRLVAALARIALTRHAGSVIMSGPECRARGCLAPLNNGICIVHPGVSWATQWNAGLARHPEGDESWDREWMTIVFIDTPTGQLSWHVHDSELALFQGLPTYATAWDGHSSEEKYRRLELVR